MLQLLPAQTVEYMKDAFNEILHKRDVPHQWKTVHIYPLMKNKDHPGDPYNWRPIALMSVVYKLLQAILASRLQEQCAAMELFGPDQFEFLRGRRIDTPISDVLTVITNAGMRRREFHLCALDLAKAYDSVSPSRLRAGLCRLGLEPAFVEYVRNIYQAGAGASSRPMGSRASSPLKGALARVTP